MLYFAYGSNMDVDRMRARCPSAAFVGVAVLQHHRLAFTRRGRAGGGVADIVPDPDADVWGVLYRIADADAAALDRAEGFRPGRPRHRNAYERFEAIVLRDGVADEPVKAWLYRVVGKQPADIPALASYKGHIVTGARHWGLPAAYQERLAAIRTVDGASFR